MDVSQAIADRWRNHTTQPGKDHHKADSRPGINRADTLCFNDRCYENGHKPIANHTGNYNSRPNDEAVRYGQQTGADRHHQGSRNQYLLP